MNKERFKDIVTHPLFISLIICGIAVVFIPPIFQKYHLKLVTTVSTGPKIRYYFSDIDGDGISERFSLDLNDKDQTKVVITREEKVIDQYNFRYQAIGQSDFFTGDYNGDQFKECFLFTKSADSILLNVFEPTILRKVLVSNRFIDSVWVPAQSEDKPVIVPVGLDLKKSSNNRDFVFYIRTGYALKPRRVYRYSIDNDTIIKSPLSTANITGCYPCDINDDGLNEFVLNTDASYNYKEDDLFSDYYAWLMVLDNNLRFRFPPVKFKEFPSRMKVLPLKTIGKTNLLLFHDYFGTKDILSAFYLYDIYGNLKRMSLTGPCDHPSAEIYPDPNSNKGTFYFLRNSKGVIEKIDSNFITVSKFSIPPVESGHPFAVLDADSDGANEYILLGRQNLSLIITRGNLRYPAIFRLNNEDLPRYVSEVHEPGEASQIYVQFSDSGAFLTYGRNPLHILKYIFYIALYLLVFSFVFGLQRIQNYRLNLKLATEKRIASLQMKAIKNQIEPHFTLNILNAIGSLYSTEKDRDKADYIFSKYARLIRQTVITSDQIVISLAEELDFVKNYVDLERFRSNNSFNVDISASPDVDTSVKVPRMLVHTFVENAIKYGVKKAESAGILKIEARNEGNKIIIAIEDNGPGMNTGNSPEGTGKGLSIVNEMIELYFRLERVKISYNLRNIMTDRGSVRGTLAEIEIPFNPARPVR